MIFKRTLLPFSLLLSTIAFGQSEMDLLLKEYNTRSVPYISVQELVVDCDQYLILDTRTKEEFEVSHIPGAIWVSEKVNDRIYTVDNTDTNKAIVVYCSVGIRSEDYGEQLKKLGFTNVHNLYGSIFAWQDQGYELVNAREQKTDSVHVFSNVWGKYLKTGVRVF